MPAELHDVDALRSLLGSEAQLLEVLPEQEYEEEHLPGAVNISLKKLTPAALDTLDRTRPVVVYCWDDA